MLRLASFGEAVVQMHKKTRIGRWRRVVLLGSFRVHQQPKKRGQAEGGRQKLRSLQKCVRQSANAENVFNEVSMTGILKESGQLVPIR